MTVLARTDNFTATTELIVEECCNCHCLFAMPKELELRARDDSSIWFYCPLGHQQHYYTGPSEATKLRWKLDMEEAAAVRLRSRLDQAQADAEHQRSRANGYKGALTKTKKRVGNGVCPCCDRSFTDLRRHMASKHPGYTATS